MHSYKFSNNQAIMEGCRLDLVKTPYLENLLVCL